MNILKGPSAIVLIIVTCLLSRLPQLISPELVLDGDECVVALMAKYMYLGKDFTLFFWGQDYGFSLIECAFILPFYALLGVTTLAVKLGMLSLWTTGVVFLYKTMKAINHRHPNLPLLLIIIFIAMPAWAVWSMKARGGYLTAFTLSNIITYLLFRRQEARQFTFIIVGFLIVLVYESQPFWLTGIGPLVLYVLVKKKSLKLASFTALSFLATFFLSYYYKTTYLPAFHPTPFIPTADNLWYYTERFPTFLYNSLHGNYFFVNHQKPNLFCAIGAIFCSVLIYALVVLALYHLVFKRKRKMFFIFSTLCFPLILGYSILSEQMHFRYLLPITGFAFFALNVYLSNVQEVRLLRPLLMSVTIAGFISLITFYGFDAPKINRQRDITALVNYLEQRDIYYTFSVDCMLLYQIMFYSNEKVMSRMPYEPGRYPPHEDIVDSAFYKGRATALVGIDGEVYEMNLPPCEKVATFFFLANPSRDLLLQRFQFKF